MKLKTINNNNIINIVIKACKGQKACIFDNMIEVAFQITFRAEIHVNDIFLFFKNYF